MRLKTELRWALLAVGCFLIGCAEDAGREWTSLRAADTSLIFTAPGLESTTKRFLRSEAENYSHTIEIGLWASPVKPFPKAQMLLQILTPGYVYTSGMDIEQYIRGLNFLKEKSPSIGPTAYAASKIGRLAYRVFTFDDLECMALGHNFGDLAIDEMPRELTGKNILIGFYCADPGHTLSPEVIAQVGQGIAVKGFGPP